MSRIELICVGSELLGIHVNTHERYIGRRLRESGLELSRALTMPDDEKALAAAIRESLKRADAVLLSGGLGPTFDDITREATARALGRKLIYKSALWKGIQAKLSGRGFAIPEENKRQAWLVQGGRALENERGSAPGQMIGVGRKLVAMMPGPYSELSPIFEGVILPRLVKKFGRGAHTRSVVFRLSGVAESVADEKLAFLTRNPPEGTTFTILAGSGQVDFHANVTAKSAAAADQALAEIAAKVRGAVGDHLFGEGDISLEKAVGAALLKRGWTLAVAESCTGGGLGKRLTGVDGSSRYFLGGVIAYSNELKKKLLGVSAATLDRHGAVSPECAAEMAAGARKACGASIAVSITGVAGPGGGTSTKPVGLVYLGVSAPGLAKTMELRVGGDREAVRDRSAAAALNLALRCCRMTPA